MAVHPCVKNVLVIGAGDGGVIRELVRYKDIENIDMVEIDEQVVEVCKKYLPQTAGWLDDERVHIRYEDGLRFIRACHDRYDLIIVDSTDPFGPGEGLFTREFYGGIPCRYYTTTLHKGAFYLPAYVEELLANVELTPD